MNEIFNFHGQEVRTLTIDDEPWFVGKDVADILGYAKPLDAILVSTLLSYPASCLKLRSLSVG